MTAALLLLTIAIADLIMLVWLSVERRAWGIEAAIIVLIGWPLVLIGCFSTPWWLALGVVAAAALWALAMSSRWAPRLVIPLGLLLAAKLCVLLMVPYFATLVHPAWVDAWVRAGAVVPPAAAVMSVAVAVFLAHTANVVVRATLTLARRSDAPLGTPGVVREPASPASWVIAARWARIQVIPPAPAAPHVISTMRGGRWIGPLERWAIVALGLTGAVGIIAALMAGKGIVRFPEINADRGIGSKAEEFLVGSLLSWSLAGCGVALIVGAASVGS